MSPQSFINKSSLHNSQAQKFDYTGRTILPQLPVKKQQAKRHFGVHGYFTKQSWNVVQKYIENFTKPDDVVLDCFGGSGVTFIEAIMIGRKGIHIDINPMSNFITESLITHIKVDQLYNVFIEIKSLFERKSPKTEKDFIEFLRKYPYPQGIPLIKGSDVDYIEELFTNEQLAHLSYLKHIIKKIKDKSVRQCLLLAFSSTITKYNKTYHPSSSRGDNAGDCAAFRYYRYRVAKKSVNLNLMNIFETKVKKLISAKNEIFAVVDPAKIKECKIIKASASNLPLDNESVDYIYTDPPYGSKIPYLDLSVMWNGWLDLDVTKEDYILEAIEGGSLNKSTNDYTLLIQTSIKEMYRVLQFDRWLSFVFAHKDPKYWHLIVETAEKVGFEYAGAVKQPNGQTSYKKRQNPFSVLSGQLIVNFRKVRTPESIQKIKLGADVFEIIIETIESVIAQDDGATLEQINDELIMKGLELGFLDVLSREYRDLTSILLEHFEYDDTSGLFQIKKNKTFKTHIDVHLRIRYFLISYLKRKKSEKINPSTDQIILDIMPLLKNGVTPENQSILNVLDLVANKVCNDSWVIKSDYHLNL